MTFRFSARSLAALSTVALAIASTACGGSAAVPGTTGPSTGDPNPTKPSGPTSDPNAPADPIADPVPSDIPVLAAHAIAGDVAPDLSCAGQPLPVTGAPLGQHEFHLTELGADDTARVGGLPVELFYDDDASHAADATYTAKAKSDDKQSTGIFQANSPQGFIAFHVAKADGYVDTTSLDLDVRGEGPFLATVAPSGTVTALSILIGGSSYTPTPGAGRLVVRAVDCKGNPLVNAHVAMEVDGVVTALAIKPNDTGIRRSYFGDAELPGPGKWSSHSGVVAFIDVPTGKSVRLVVRGKNADGTPASVIAMRKVPVVGDGVVTAKVTPYTTK